MFKNMTCYCFGILAFFGLSSLASVVHADAVLDRLNSQIDVSDLPEKCQSDAATQENSANPKTGEIRAACLVVSRTNPKITAIIEPKMFAQNKWRTLVPLFDQTNDDAEQDSLKGICHLFGFSSYVWTSARYDRHSWFAANDVVIDSSGQFVGYHSSRTFGGDGYLNVIHCSTGE